MKKACCSLLLLAAFTAMMGQRVNRPNIIVFLVDDMGWMDSAVPFADSIMPLNRRYHTPNMLRLAREGMLFKSAYAQPVCTPSRVSMLTGMNAARTRITNWTSPQKDNSTDEKDQQFQPLNWNVNGLSNSPATPNALFATSFPQLLKQARYYTIHVGKAHWGSAGTPGANPYNLGFMVNVAGHAAGHPQSYLSEQNYGNLPGKAQAQAVPDLEAYYNTGSFLTEALTQEAIQSIHNAIDLKKPFFLNMAHYAVHTPIMADPRFVQSYYAAGIDSVEAAYASLIEGMDKSLGDIMDCLQQKGIDKNTIIIFMSDNGGLDHHQRSGNANTHNYPLRSGKGSVYEGGIREPMIVKWPGVARPGSSSAHPVIIEDFFPSILEMAGIQKPVYTQTTDGHSFVPALKYSKLKASERPLIFHYPNKWINLADEAALGINYYSAIRLGQWKLIYNMRNRQFELYNLVTDISERNNLVSTRPDICKKLAMLRAGPLKPGAHKCRWRNQRVKQCRFRMS